MQAAAFDIVAFWLYMITPVKNSANHLIVFREHYVKVVQLHCIVCHLEILKSHLTCL